MKLTLSPKQTKQALIQILKSKLVPLLVSSPGMGKSSIYADIAKEFNLELIDVRLGQADITDLNGLPKFTTVKMANGTVRDKGEFIPFNSFPLEGEELPEGKQGWLLFFDELTSAPKDIQAASYKTILDRMVGKYRLHPKVIIAAAGNKDTDNAVTYSMSTALQSRLIHLEMHTDHGEWMDWASDNGIDSRIIAYLNFRKEHLNTFNPDHMDKTYACERTWAFASALIQGKEVDDVTRTILAGTLGQGVAMEFHGFLQVYQEIPTLNDILKSPEECKVPSEASGKYAVAVNLVEQFTQKNADDLIKYLRRFPAEHQVTCIRLLNKRRPEMLSHKAISDLLIALSKKMI